MSKIIIVAAVLTALSLVTGAITAEGDVVPKRKPGAWEIITVAPVSGMTKATICVGEDDDTDGQDEFGSADLGKDLVGWDWFETLCPALSRASRATGAEPGAP